jgi:hypothetical protein
MLAKNVTGGREGCGRSHRRNVSGVSHFASCHAAVISRSRRTRRLLSERCTKSGRGRSYGTPFVRRSVRDVQPVLPRVGRHIYMDRTPILISSGSRRFDDHSLRLFVWNRRARDGAHIIRAVRAHPAWWVVWLVRRRINMATQSVRIEMARFRRQVARRRS